MEAENKADRFRPSGWETTAYEHHQHRPRSWVPLGSARDDLRRSGTTIAGGGGRRRQGDTARIEGEDDMVGLGEGGSNVGGARFCCCQRTRKRSVDGEGETGRRDKETSEVERKPCPNCRERTDASECLGTENYPRSAELHVRFDRPDLLFAVASGWLLLSCLPAVAIMDGLLCFQKKLWTDY